MSSLPNLPGAELARIRAELKISSTEFAETAGLSSSTILRKEKQQPGDRLGVDVAAALSPYLVPVYDAGLTLGLSIEAIERAHEYGLRFAATPFGNLYWLPSLHRWAASFRRYFPSSLASQALHLAAELGLDNSEGVARCGLCELPDGSARVALRKCRFCQVSLCVDDGCGGTYIPDAHDIRMALPIACKSCFAPRQLVRPREEPHFLPGGGSYAAQLTARYEELLQGASAAHLHGFRKIVDAGMAEAEARLIAIEVSLSAEDVIAAPSVGQDIFINLRIALAEAKRGVLELRALQVRVAADAESDLQKPRQVV